MQASGNAVCPRSSARGPWHLRPGVSSSPWSRHRPTARYSRSAAAAATRPCRVLSLEADPGAASAWRENVSEAGLDEWAQLVEGDALETLPAIDDVFDVVFIDAKKSEYEDYFRLARERVEPGGVIVADNVLSHQDELGAYSEARRADPGLLTVTLPLDRGLELSVVLTDSL
jgi:caffeoyl-CoA O-methyltransferase